MDITDTGAGNPTGSQPDAVGLFMEAMGATDAQLVTLMRAVENFVDVPLDLSD